MKVAFIEQHASTWSVIVICRFGNFTSVVNPSPLTPNRLSVWRYFGPLL